MTLFGRLLAKLRAALRQREPAAKERPIVSASPRWHSIAAFVDEVIDAVRKGLQTGTVLCRPPRSLATECISMGLTVLSLNDDLKFDLRRVS